MTICFFGIYSPKYSRNRILIDGLKQNEVEVIECRSEKRGVFKYLDLIKKHWKIRKQYDVLFVAFPGFQSMILARFLTRKKIIFDSFAPIYESEVLDRKNIKRNSFKAKYYWFLDWLSVKLADVVLLDTNEHINYFVQEFGIKKEKFERVFIGVDDLFLKSTLINKKEDKFIVHFHGTNIPLQGIKYILEASLLLKEYSDIRFVFVGPNIAKDKRFSSYDLNNIDIVGKVPYSKIPDCIDKSNICIGILGDTHKTQRVIPNKVYECVSRKRPVITANTPAIRELFNENDLYLIPTANSKELARAILDLKNNSKKIDYLVQNSYNKFIQSSVPNVLGAKLKNIIQSLI